jgi:hypothetical protein
MKTTARATEIKVEAFKGLVTVKCKGANDRPVGEFRCFTLDGALLVANAYQHVSTEAARAVYITLYAADLEKIDDDTDLGDFGEHARADLALATGKGL